LAEAAQDRTVVVHPVLRRRDLLDLFDTSPDLGGNDIDVSPFIRDTRDSAVSVAWRRWTDEEPQMPPVGRGELCPAPISAVRAMIRGRTTRALVDDQVRGQWRRAWSEDVRPGAVVVLDAARGGYRPEYGFDADSHAPVQPVPPPAAVPDAVDADPHTVGCGRWVALDEHLADTEREARTLLAQCGELPGLDDGHREAVALAARYHDLGKAHPVFVASLEKVAAEYPMPEAGVVWAKSPGRVPLRHQPPHFRHELVSALVLQEETTGLLAGVAEPDLVVYLALAHHGKVRLAVRGHLDEPENQILGVTDGESTVECRLPDGTVLPARVLSLAPTRMGRDSLAAHALALRDRDDLGPFRLAFCEALVRSADWRASARYDGSAR
jgi:CRISPR-associated endonuclease/helicase Cas3